MFGFGSKTEAYFNRKEAELTVEKKQQAWQRIRNLDACIRTAKADGDNDHASAMEHRVKDELSIMTQCDRRLREISCDVHEANYNF